MADTDKPLAWLHGEIKTPPLGHSARLEVGLSLRQLQQGEMLSMPHSRPMPDIGPRCHELRIQDEASIWRLIYRTDPDAIVIVDVFQKTTRTTPRERIDACRRRLAAYDLASK